MIEKVRKTIEKYHMLEYGDRVAAGVSGGADSVALLMVLLELQKDYDLSITVVHVNHMLRDAAAEEESYVKELCEKSGIPCEVYRKDIHAYANEMACSTEEAGRIYRYQCFRETAQKYGCTKLAVAHHMNDRVETVLFHMTRGTELKGMRGIPAVRNMEPDSITDRMPDSSEPADVQNALLVIRPLYELQREIIEEYLKDRGILYYTDESNRDILYARNRIRNRVIPELSTINSEAVRHIADISDQSAAYFEYVEQQAIQYEREKIRDHSLRISELLACPELLQRHIIYRQLSEAAGKERDLEAAHVEAVRALLSSHGEKQLDLPYHIRVIKTYDHISFESNGEGTETHLLRASSASADCLYMKLREDIIIDGKDLQTEYSFSVPGMGNWSLRIGDRNRITDISKKIYTKMLDYDTIKNTLCIRNPHDGDYVVINSKRDHKRLSRILIDQKITKALRDQIVVVADGSHVIWIPGIRISEACKITETTRRVLLLSLEPERDR